MTTPKQWREAVRRSDAPPQVKLLCDYLSERMWQGRTRYNGVPRWVSVPRSVMAEDLGTPERTVDRWVTQAVKAGVLTVVRRGREGHTAEYQGLVPATPREIGGTTGESYADVRGSTDDPTHATTGESYADVRGIAFASELRTSAHLDPRNDAGELRTSAHPIVTHHSGRADGLGQALVEPDSPELEETFPEDDRADTSGTPADHRATGPAEVLEQGNNDDTGGRVNGSTSRPPAPVAADPTAPQPQGDRGHLAAVPPLDRSRRATDERGQLDSDNEKGSHANPFPGSADGRKGFRRGTEKGSPVNPHQGNYQWCADAPGEGEVPAGPADEWVPADEPLDDPEDEEIFPDDPDELSGTPADHRANADAEVLEQGQQQRNGRRSARPAPRQPEAGRQLDHDATTPVAAVGSATTRGRKATA